MRLGPGVKRPTGWADHAGCIPPILIIIRATCTPSTSPTPAKSHLNSKFSYPHTHAHRTSIQEVVAALSAAPQNATAYTGAASSWVVCSPPPSADSIRAVAGVAVTYAVPLTAEGAAAYAAQCGGDTSSGTTSSSTTSSSTAAAVTPLQLSSSLTCALVPVAGGPTVPSDRDLMAAPPGVGGNTYAGGPPPAGDAGSGGGRSGIDRSLAVILAGMAVGGAILITCSVTALVLVLRRRERRLEEEARRKRLREEGGEAAAAAAAAAAGGGRGLQAVGGRAGSLRSLMTGTGLPIASFGVWSVAFM